MYRCPLLASGHRFEFLLHLGEGIPRSRQTPLGQGYGPGAAGAQGVRFGTPTAQTRSDGQRWVVSVRQNAVRMPPVIADSRAWGHASLRAIAAELNARGMLTRPGGPWHVSIVETLLARITVNGNSWRQSRRILDNVEYGAFSAAISASCS